jgi:hypothetical protein
MVAVLVCAKGTNTNTNFNNNNNNNNYIDSNNNNNNNNKHIPMNFSPIFVKKTEDAIIHLPSAGSPESGRVLLGVGSRVASRSAMDAGRVSGAAPGAPIGFWGRRNVRQRKARNAATYSKR